MNPTIGEEETECPCSCWQPACDHEEVSFGGEGLKGGKKELIKENLSRIPNILYWGHSGL